MERELERRYLRRSAPVVSDAGALNGRAIAYDQWTMIGKAPWGFREKVNPKAANKTLNDGDLVLLDNHDTARPLARMSAGTLTIRNDGEGMDWDASPPDTTYAQDAIKNARAGNYGGCSFGFEVVRDKWTVGEDGIDEREILEAKVHEISICTFPAYDTTSVYARDQVDAAREARKRFEDRATGVEAKPDVTEQRAPKATYADVETCGECDSPNQYGQFCTNCGASMSQNSSPGGKFCGSCGGKISRSADEDDIEIRSEPVTSTRDDENRRMRLRMIEADLNVEVA